MWAHYLYTENPDYIYVRDSQADLTYLGKLVYFSDSGESRELVLSDVSVYPNNQKHNTKELYSVDKLYLSRNNNDLTIEIPKKI